MIAELFRIPVAGALFVPAADLTDRRIEIHQFSPDPGPAPDDQALLSDSASTLSSGPMWPKVNERKKLPSVDGAITR